MIQIFQPIAGAAAFAFTPPAWAFAAAASLVKMPSFGPHAYTGDAARAEPTFAGDEIQAFGGDFFDRVHYSFKLAELGNVIGQQSIALYVWNAFRRSERLVNVTGTNSDGITLSGGSPSLPFSVEPLRELTYTFTVNTDGPPTINATFAFDWQTADDAVRITGSRITAWSFVPDWTNGILERLEWKTDVLQTFDASEQRRALRLAPRKGYEFEAFFTGQERRYAEALLWGWGARAWALPIWQDGTDLSVQAAAGATEVFVDTATRDYEAGSLALLLRDALTNEVAEIESVQADRIVLKRALVQTWPIGSRLWPARVARLQEQVRLPRWDSNASGMRVAFDLEEPVDYTADAGAATHRGYPVLTERPNWTGGLDLDLARKLSELDAMIGPRAIEDEADMPLPMQRMRWTWITRAQVDTYRRLLYALRGRHGAAWVPTWAADLVPVAQIGDAALAIDVEFSAYTLQIQTGVGRRDIRIELTDGAVFFRRINNAQQLNATTERLTIDAALGRIVQPADVAMVSFMSLMRLDGDGVEIAHWTGETAETAVVLKGFKSDI